MDTTTPPPLAMTNSEQFISDISNFETQVEGSTRIEMETLPEITSRRMSILPRAETSKLIHDYMVLRFVFPDGLRINTVFHRKTRGKHLYKFACKIVNTSPLVLFRADASALPENKQICKTIQNNSSIFIADLNSRITALQSVVGNEFRESQNPDAKKFYFVKIPSY
jgi:hypothetical protein